MYSVSGSLDQSVEEGPKLTPFEQADYNLAKFVMSAQFHYELDSVLKRIDALEKVKKRCEDLIETSESVTIKLATKKNLAEIEEELMATDFVLQALCETYNKEV